VSTKYFEPVTVPAAPKKWTFILLFFIFIALIRSA